MQVEEFANKINHNVQDIQGAVMAICAALKLSAPEIAATLQTIVAGMAADAQKLGRADDLFQHMLSQLRVEFPQQPLPEPSKPTLHLVQPDPDGS